MYGAIVMCPIGRMARGSEDGDCLLHCVATVPGSDLVVAVYPVTTLAHLEHLY